MNRILKYILVIVIVSPALLLNSCKKDYPKDIPDWLKQNIENREKREKDKNYNCPPVGSITIYELKNGQGPSPLKTKYGWLHLAHGVRNTAAGLRYTLYMFMTDLNDLTKVIYKPGGYFLAPEGEERIGDVSNVAFCNGWIADDDGTVYIYYASSDTRMHVAISSIDQLLDYTMKNPEDGFRSATSVETLTQLIKKNKAMENAVVK